jgi:hypothetical protein
MRLTNRKRIEEYIVINGSITALEAADRLRITSLSQEITRLEQIGYVFDHIPEKNESTHWTRYKLMRTPFKLELVG